MPRSKEMMRIKKEIERQHKEAERRKREHERKMRIEEAVEKKMEKKLKKAEKRKKKSDNGVCGEKESGNAPSSDVSSTSLKSSSFTSTSSDHDTSAAISQPGGAVLEDKMDVDESEQERKLFLERLREKELQRNMEEDDRIQIKRPKDAIKQPTAASTKSNQRRNAARGKNKSQAQMSFSKHDGTSEANTYVKKQEIDDTSWISSIWDIPSTNRFTPLMPTKSENDSNSHWPVLNKNKKISPTVHVVGEIDDESTTWVTVNHKKRDLLNQSPLSQETSNKTTEDINVQKRKKVFSALSSNSLQPVGMVNASDSNLFHPIQALPQKEQLSVSPLHQSTPSQKNNYSDCLKSSRTCSPDDTNIEMSTFGRAQSIRTPSPGGMRFELSPFGCPKPARTPSPGGMRLELSPFGCSKPARTPSPGGMRLELSPFGCSKPARTPSPGGMRLELSPFGCSKPARTTSPGTLRLEIQERHAHSPFDKNPNHDNNFSGNTSWRSNDEMMPAPSMEEWIKMRKTGVQSSEHRNINNSSNKTNMEVNMELDRQSSENGIENQQNVESKETLKRSTVHDINTKTLNMKQECDNQKRESNHAYELDKTNVASRSTTPEHWESLIEYELDEVNKEPVGVSSETNPKLLKRSHRPTRALYQVPGRRESLNIEAKRTKLTSSTIDKKQQCSIDKTGNKNGAQNSNTSKFLDSNNGNKNGAQNLNTSKFLDSNNVVPNFSFPTGVFPSNEMLQLSLSIQKQQEQLLKMMMSASNSSESVGSLQKNTPLVEAARYVASNNINLSQNKAGYNQTSSRVNEYSTIKKKELSDNDVQNLLNNYMSRLKLDKEASVSENVTTDSVKSDLAPLRKPTTSMRCNNRNAETERLTQGNIYMDDPNFSHCERVCNDHRSKSEAPTFAGQVQTNQVSQTVSLSSETSKSLNRPILKRNRLPKALRIGNELQACKPLIKPVTCETPNQLITTAQNLDIEQHAQVTTAVNAAHTSSSEDHIPCRKPRDDVLKKIIRSGKTRKTNSFQELLTTGKLIPVCASSINVTGSQKPQSIDNVHQKPQSSEIVSQKHQSTDVVSQKHQSTDIVSQKPQTTVIVSQNPQTTVIVSPKPQTTVIVSPKPQTTVIVSEKPQTTVIVSPKPQTTVIVSQNPQTTNIVSPKPQTTVIVSPKPQTTAIVSQKPQITDIVSPKPQTTVIVSPKPQTTVIVSPKPQTTVIVSQKPQITDIVSPKPQTTDMINQKPQTTENVNKREQSTINECQKLQSAINECQKLQSAINTLCKRPASTVSHSHGNSFQGPIPNGNLFQRSMSTTGGSLRPQPMPHSYGNNFLGSNGNLLQGSIFDVLLMRMSSSNIPQRHGSFSNQGQYPLFNGNIPQSPFPFGTPQGYTGTRYGPALNNNFSQGYMPTRYGPALNNNFPQGYMPTRYGPVLNSNFPQGHLSTPTPMNRIPQPAPSFNMPQPHLSTSSMPQPPSSTSLMPKPPLSTSCIPQPPSSTSLVPQPLSSTSLVPQPPSSTSLVSQPLSSTSLVPQPLSSTSIVPQPSLSTSQMTQPPSPTSLMLQPSSTTSLMTQPSSPTSYMPGPPSPTSLMPQSHSSTNLMPQPSSTTSLMTQPSSSTSLVPQPPSSTSLMLQPSSSTSLMPQPSSSTSLMTQPSSPTSLMPQSPSPTSLMPQPSSSTSYMPGPPSSTSLMLQPSSSTNLRTQPSSSTSLMTQPSSPTSLMPQPPSPTSLMPQPSSSTNLMPQPSSSTSYMPGPPSSTSYMPQSPSSTSYMPGPPSSTSLMPQPPSSTSLVPQPPSSTSSQAVPSGHICHQPLPSTTSQKPQGSVQCKNTTNVLYPTPANTSMVEIGSLFTDVTNSKLSTVFPQTNSSVTHRESSSDRKRHQGEASLCGKENDSTKRDNSVLMEESLTDTEIEESSTKEQESDSACSSEHDVNNGSSSSLDRLMEALDKLSIPNKYSTSATKLMPKFKKFTS